MIGRRSLLMGSACLLVPLVSRSAIVAVSTTDPTVRHRLDWSQLTALNGTTLKVAASTVPLRSDFERLLGSRFARFMIGLTDELPIECQRDAIVGEGSRPGTLGCEASLFVLGRDGAMFVAIKVATAKTSRPSAMQPS
jgi:hypothetical protein